jgi:polyhydroxyalkanoate synthesis regulator phasin
MSTAKTVRWDARAAWLEESRDHWKAKAQARTEEIKRLKVQVTDVQNSRSEWRGRAEDAGEASRAQAERIEALQREVETLRDELEKKRRS